MIYRLRREDGTVVDKIMSWVEYDAAKTGPDTITVDGETMTRVYDSDATAADSPKGDWKTVYSDALGVKPGDIQKAQAEAKRHGIELQHTPDGRAIFDSRQKREAYMRMRGVHNRNSYSRY